MERKEQRACGAQRRGPLRERGQTLVVAAIVLVGLVAFVALVVDLGNVYAQRRLMQNAADAAALAGARRLALGQPLEAIDAAVKEYARNRNGAQSYGLQVLTDTVVVTVSETFPTYFASVLGVRTMTVGAIAQAAYGSPASVEGGLMPMAVHSEVVKMLKPCKDPKDPLEDCPEVQIWDDSSTTTDYDAGRVGDGQRGWLNFDGGAVGDSELVDWIMNGYPGEVKADSWVNGTPGTKTSSLQAVAQYHTGELVLVPIYDETKEGTMGSGSLDYHICGFAAFYVQFVKDTGNPKYVTGKFAYVVTSQKIDPRKYDSGLRVIALQ